MRVGLIVAASMAVGVVFVVALCWAAGGGGELTAPSVVEGSSFRLWAELDALEQAQQ